MFIELTKPISNEKFLINVDDISTAETIGNKFTCVVLRDNRRINVKESYIDVWYMLKQKQCI